MNAALLETEILSGGIPIRVGRFKAHVPATIEFEPDARAMNHMDPDTKVVHARVCDWSKHARRILGAKGYPPESYYSAWAALGIQPNPGFESEMPLRAFNVDKSISLLGDIDRSVIWRKYVQYRPVDIWKGLRGIESKRHFHKVWNRALHRIEGILMQIEKNI